MAPLKNIKLKYPGSAHEHGRTLAIRKRRYAYFQQRVLQTQGAKTSREKQVHTRMLNCLRRAKKELEETA